MQLLLYVNVVVMRDVDMKWRYWLMMTLDVENNAVDVTRSYVPVVVKVDLGFDLFNKMFFPDSY